MAARRRRTIRTILLLSGSFLAGLAAAALHPAFRASLFSAIGAALGYLFGLTPVPRVIVILLLLAAIPSLVPLIRLIVTARRPSPQQAYRSDVILDIRWHWRYNVTDRSIVALTSHCPDDDSPLDCSPAYQSVTFTCPACRRSFGPYPGSIRGLLDRVQRRILHAIRTGSWRWRNTASAELHETPFHSLREHQ